MSHDRGCHCGREPMEYAECPDPGCRRAHDARARRDCATNLKATVTTEGVTIAPNERQVGGDHYRSEYQHWDFVELNGLGYLEGCATKYVSRWRKKGGQQDLEKAGHYVDKLIELFKAGRRNPRTHANMEEVMRFCRANDLDGVETIAIVKLSKWSELCDLKSARAAIDTLIELCHE